MGRDPSSYKIIENADEKGKQNSKTVKCSEQINELDVCRAAGPWKHHGPKDAEGDEEEEKQRKRGVNNSLIPSELF